jgi:hypothetical protein
MIDRTHDLPVKQQCQILSLARSTAYYRPQEASEADLVLMRRIGTGSGDGRAGLPTAPHALALRMGRRAAPWITLHPQSPT